MPVPATCNFQVFLVLVSRPCRNGKIRRTVRKHYRDIIASKWRLEDETDLNVSTIKT